MVNIKSTDFFLTLVFVSVVFNTNGFIKLYRLPITMSLNIAFWKNSYATSTADRYNDILFSSKQLLSNTVQFVKNSSYSRVFLVPYSNASFMLFKARSLSYQSLD